MKTYKHLFEQMVTPEAVYYAAMDAAEHKIHRKEVMKALTHFDDTYDYVIQCINDPCWRPCEDNVHEIIDGANNKQREIEKPLFCPEQIVHHMLIEPFKPVLMNGLYEQVYGCLPPIVEKVVNGVPYVRRFGPHAAIHQLCKWVQNKGEIYVCESDIHHAYGSVHIPTLARQMERVIKDRQWLDLTYKFLHYSSDNPNCQNLRGLILGHYTSPWFFNFYLKEFDHVMAGQPGIHYMRFADNFFICGPDKNQVHSAIRLARKYLSENLSLELNPCTQVYRFEYFDKQTNKVRGRAINALGSVIHYNRVTLRKSILERMRRKAHRISRKTRVTWHDGASMLSRLSYTRGTQCYSYYLKHIKPIIDVRMLKRKVRLHSRAIQPIAEQRRRRINDSMEKSTRLPKYIIGAV